MTEVPGTQRAELRPHRLTSQLIAYRALIPICRSAKAYRSHRKVAAEVFTPLMQAPVRGTQPRYGCHRQVRLAFLLLGLALACAAAPQTNSVVDKALSPDGRYLAVLVERYYHIARVSDEFFLMLMPAGQNVEDAISASNADLPAAFVATSAKGVRLLWKDDETLQVACESCGLQSIDIVKKLEHVGPIKIVYVGFPVGTA